MGQLGFKQYMKTMPAAVLPHLPAELDHLQPRQPFQWIVQFYDTDPRIHYEVSRAPHRRELELSLHLESRDKALNKFVLDGFMRHLFEIKATLGNHIEAEMWDRGWAKVYELVPGDELTTEHQQEQGQRLATIIACLHPILTDLIREHRRAAQKRSRV